MWYLWEASTGKFSVLCEMREMDPWMMHKSKEGDPKIGKRFCVWKMQAVHDGLVEPVEVMCEEVETMRGFCCLKDSVNASGGCEAAVTARARIGWVKFKECGELLNSKSSRIRQKEWFTRVV